jgi:alpha-L-arabinofuranosidase
MRLGAEGDTQNMLEIGGGIWSTWVPPTTEIIATGRWYDVRLELQGGSIRCFLDGSLVGETRRPAPQPIYAAAGIDRATGEVVLFAVNPALSAVSATIDLGGRTGAAAGGRAIVLTSDRPDDKNSFEEPDRVAPRETVLPAEPARFAYQFPANSVTVLRLRPE